MQGTRCKSMASVLILVTDTKIAETAISFLALEALDSCLNSDLSYRSFNK